jgi:hypothetical protein
VGRAARQGAAHAVAAWLDKGGGVDASCAEHYGATLLMAAAVGGHEAMVRMLLQRGASVNLQDSVGGTALMHAANNGHTATVQALLDAKADASLQATEGDTALMIAELYKHTATAQLLREHATRLTAEAEAKAASAEAELLAEEAAEKEAAAIKRAKGKKKKAKAAPSTAAADLAEADALASTTRPAVAEEGLPEGVGACGAPGRCARRGCVAGQGRRRGRKLRRAWRRDAADGGRRGRARGDDAYAAAARRERQPAALPRHHRPDGRCSQWPHHDRAGAARCQGRRLAAGEQRPHGAHAGREAEAHRRDSAAAPAARRAAGG